MKNKNIGQSIQFDENWFSPKKILIFLSIIVVISFILRIHFLNFEIPLTHDSLNYFFYAIDIKINNQLPVYYSLANPGWGMFLSTFFSIFEFQNVIDYMNMQRILSISLSALTVLPTYLLCKKFFGKHYSLLGAIIIGLEPHLIQNSLFGISDSFYILLIVITFLLYFSKNKKITYLSFLFVALSTIVRSEGIFILITLFIMFIARKDSLKIKIRDIVISGIIFSAIILPFTIIQIESNEIDPFGRVIYTVEGHIIDPGKSTEITGVSFILNGLQNFPKYLGWNLIPIFLPFVPIGFVLMFKNWNYQIKTIFTGLILMSMPSFYAYSISIQDGRYIFFLYPFFVILSLITIEKISKKINVKLIFCTIIIFIIISSVTYSIFKIEKEQSNEYFYIAQKISETPKMINDYGKSEYLEPINYSKKFDEFIKLYEVDKLNKKSIRYSIPQQILIVPILNNQNINEFINSNKNNLTHIIVEDKSESLLYDIFINEKKYSYLEKEFDSSTNDFQYSIKIFKINYEEFFKNSSR